MASAAGPVGIIYPPRDIRGVIDKTAQFVAKCGPEFEGRVRKEQNSKKFDFLDVGHPFRPYYEFKVKEFQAGKEGETKVEKPAALQKAEAEIAAKKEKKALKMLDNKEHLEKAQEIGPPPADAYTVIHPTITPLDADVIQLTAQFVARNGQKFLIGLTQRESRNPQFDFLKPTHPLFSYFTSLVDGYTKVLMPSKEELAEIKRYLGASGFQHILEKSTRRFRWEEEEEKKKKAEEDQKELEREQMAMIDWHDFVVVETIDFTEEDNDNPLAAPIDTTKAIVETPAEALDVETQKVMPPAIIEEEEPMELEEEVETKEEEKKEDAKKASRKVIEDAEPDDLDKEDAMDISDGEEVEMEQRPAVKSEKDEKKKVEDEDVIALPDDLDDEKVTVKTDYVRNKRKEVEVQQLQKCPLTGEFLPVDDMNEHLRIAMLNPQWKKDQDSQQTKKKQENLFAEDVEANLAAFVAKRPDIFGTVDEEIQVAAEAGAEQSAREAGADAGPAAAVYNPEAVKSLPPAPPSAGGVPHMMQMNPMPALPAHMAQNNMYHGMQPPPHILPPGYKQPGDDGGDSGDDEPTAKRQKIETTLLPEFQWAQSHPRPVQIKVRISPELGVSKTELTITVEVTKTILTFKTMLESLTGVTASKMQIRDDRTTLVMRQTRSLAFYNLKEGSSVEMMPKERGGKRK